MRLSLRTQSKALVLLTGISLGWMNGRISVKMLKCRCLAIIPFSSSFCMHARLIFCKILDCPSSARISIATNVSCSDSRMPLGTEATVVTKIQSASSISSHSLKCQT